MNILSERVTLDGAFLVVDSASISELDPFQPIGIPCWQSFAGPLSEPEEPPCEND